MPDRNPPTRRKPPTRRQPARAPGFTLVEVLVVVGILAVLVGILLPAMATARRHARDAACAGKVRQLVQACGLFKAQTRHWPTVMNLQPHNNVFPSYVMSSHLNELAPFLGYPKVTDATPPEALPAAVLSTAYEDNPGLTRGPYTNGDTYWVTGYAYYGRIDEGPRAAAQIIRKDRVASDGATNASGVGVLYADTVNYYSFTNIYSFGHSSRGSGGESNSPDGIRGLHAGYADGSVGWESLTAADLGPTERDKTAAYKVSLHTGEGYNFWWN